MSQPARPDAPADLADLARLTSPTERRALIERVARERNVWTLETWEAWKKAHPLPPDAPGEDYDHEAARAQLGARR